MCVEIVMTYFIQEQSQKSIFLHVMKVITIVKYRKRENRNVNDNEKNGAEKFVADQFNCHSLALNLTLTAI